MDPEEVVIMVYGGEGSYEGALNDGMAWRGRAWATASFLHNAVWNERCGYTHYKLFRSGQAHGPETGSYSIMFWDRACGIGQILYGI